MKTAKEAFRIAVSVRKRGIHLVEIWLDPLPMREREILLKKLEKPFIVKSNDTNNLLYSLEFHPAFIDIDFFTPRKEILKLKKEARLHGVKVILSFHGFHKTPSLLNLVKIIKKSFALGADIAKVATMVNHSEDNVILFELAARMKAQKKKVIALGMGEKGKIARIGTPLLGGYLMYMAYDEKHRTAPGQMVL